MARILTQVIMKSRSKIDASALPDTTETDAFLER